MNDENEHEFNFSLERKRTWNGFKDDINKLMTENTRWIYRGHAFHGWKLSSSIERRKFNPKQRVELEDRMIIDFKSRIHHYLSEEHYPNNKIEWLAMLQHYGACTRLLDWTYSPYIAAYFAASGNAIDSKYFCIWAIDTKVILKKSVYFLDDYKKDFYEEHNYKTMGCDETELFQFITKEKKNMVYIASPKIFNQRNLIQQGAFLYGGNIEESFERNLKAYDDHNEGKSFIRKFLIPISEQRIIINDLKLMNINSSTLFPGMEGYIKSLNDLIFEYKNAAV